MLRLIPFLLLGPPNASVAARGKASSLRPAPDINEVVRKEGFEPTRSQSDIYRPGAVIIPNQMGGHDVVVADCFGTDADVSMLSQTRIATALATGVSARLSALGAAGGGTDIQRRTSFIDPEQRTIPLSALRPTKSCQEGLSYASQLVDIGSAVVIYDVLVAQINNTTCTRTDASGRIALVGEAEAARYVECVQESKGLVPLGYKSIPATQLLGNHASTVDRVPHPVESEPLVPSAHLETREHGEREDAGDDAAIPSLAILFTRQLVQACENKEQSWPEMCFGAAQEYESGDSVPRDLSRAYDLYMQSCAGDSAEGCFAVAAAAHDGLAGPPQTVFATAAAEKSCRLGSANGCTYAGLMYHQGIGATKDLAKAAQFYEAGCEGDVPTACGYLGHLYRNGEVPSPSNHLTVSLLRRACLGGESQFCGLAGGEYLRGALVPADPQQARDLLDIGCREGNSETCYLMAQAYFSGSFGTRDLEAAARLNEQACALRSAQGCAALGYQYLGAGGVPPDDATGYKYLSQACQLGYENACSQAK